VQVAPEVSLPAQGQGDPYSRRVLAWRVSNTLDEEFSSDAFTQTLESYGIRISMDGVNRALGNIFVERFWRSLKYEDIYLSTMSSTRRATMAF
jgi:transposase InsO family protein